MVKNKEIENEINELRQQLKLYKEKTGMNNYTIASEIGCDYSYISLFLSNKRNGSIHFIEALKDFLKKNSNFS